MTHIIRLIRLLYYYLFKDSYGEFHKTSRIGKNVKIGNKRNLFMEEHTNIDADSRIMNGRARFVIKKWSGAAVGLLVVTGSHMSLIGRPFRFVTNSIKDKLDQRKEYDKEVIVEEDVWIGAHVTILQGVTVGRGSVVGAGSVLRKDTPPYSLVVGNPAKIVGYRFTPEEIIEHEKALYPESERIPLELLEKNYNKYIKAINTIKNYLKM